MARQYSAKTFIRKDPNLLLKSYFESRHIDLPIDWDGLGETVANCVFDALEALTDGAMSECLSGAGLARYAWRFEVHER